MARITVTEAQAWGESSKLKITSLEPSLLAHVEAITLAEIGRAYDPLLIQALWVNEATTPQIVRTLIAMRYVSLYYDRQYSEDEGRNPWGRRLDNMAKDLSEAIQTGSVDIPEIAGVTGIARSPRFYPNDASSDEAGATEEDPSAGPPQFTVNMAM